MDPATWMAVAQLAAAAIKKYRDSKRQKQQDTQRNQESQVRAHYLEENNKLSRDELELRRWLAKQAAPGNRLRTGVRASWTQNSTPVQANWGGPGSGKRGQTTKYTGGFANPNLISPEVRAMAGDVQNQMLDEQMRRDAPPPISQPGTAPSVEGISDDALWEQLMGLGSTGLTAYATYANRNNFNTSGYDDDEANAEYQAIIEGMNGRRRPKARYGRLPPYDPYDVPMQA